MDSGTYEALFLGFHLANNLEALFAAYQEMKTKNIKPSLNSLYLLLETIVDQQKPKLIDQIIKDIEDVFFLIPDAWILHIALHGYISSGEWKKCLTLFHQMKYRQLALPKAILVSFLRLLKQADLPNEVSRVFQQLQSDLGLDTQHNHEADSSRLSDRAKMAFEYLLDKLSA